MAKRILVSLVVAAALFGVAASGMLAKHKVLRKSAVELLRLDLEVAVGG